MNHFVSAAFILCFFDFGFVLSQTPQISGLAEYQVVSPGAVLAALTFSISPPSATIVATSSNPLLVSNTNIAVSGAGLSRTVLVTPTSGKVGTAVIRLVATGT